nr:hypothetical protein [Planctomycetales bacterium]NIP71184.1 hypothetical protein [Planctomycetales bacterium]
DVAYTLLKPAEWTARLLLKVTLPDFERLAGRLYRDPGCGMKDSRWENPVSSEESVGKKRLTQKRERSIEEGN